MTGAEMTHVPYKGTSFFQADLYENRVQVSIDNVLAHLPHLAAGKVRCLAVTSKARSPCCPTCRPWPRRACRASNRPPTTRCSRPRRCRPTSSKKLNVSGNEVVRDADFRERMLKLGIVTVGGPQEEVQAKMPTEMKRWADVIQKGNIKPS